MPSKELIEKVARVICFETGSMGDPMPIEMQRVDRDWQEHITAAKAAIFAILAALQEPTEAVLKAGHETIYEGDYDASMDFVLHPTWRAMLNASPLGEQSE
jgi:hypothetical protein